MPDARISGFETVAFCEIEPFPRKVLAKHWPEVPQYDDVRTLTAERLAADGIAVDIITGGFPCQDISFAGKGAGLAGERSGLFYEIARLIGELEPRYVILENVGALLSRGLDAVLGTLASIGYDCAWRCVPASRTGAPHKRDRIWLIAYPYGGRQPFSWGRFDAFDKKADAYREANHVVYAFQRSALPFVCRGHDGIPKKLDGCINEKSKAGPQEKLQPVQGPDQAQEVLNGPLGGLRETEAPQVLQQRVSEVGADKSQEHKSADNVCQGPKASKDGLRELRGSNKSTRSPQRSRHNKQFTGESNDALRDLPQSPPCGVDRLKALGNAVVPQIPELIGNAILASLSQERAAA